MGKASAARLIEPFLTRAAQRDIYTIWRYIAKDSEHHADLVQRAILATCYLAAEHPGIGHTRRDVQGRNLLFLAVKSYERYTVAYLGDTQPTKIVRVLHGARDVPRLLRA